MSGQGPPTGSGSYSGAPHRSFEERAAAREQMMSSVRLAEAWDFVQILSYGVSSGSPRNKTAVSTLATYPTMLSGITLKIS
jgi:hypothetical protein